MNIIISYKQKIYYGSINNIITSRTLGNNKVNKYIIIIANLIVKVMPGNTSYVDMVKKGKRVTILGDNIIGGIKQNEMNKYSKEIFI